jgi:hypothetical protein
MNRSTTSSSTSADAFDELAAMFMTPGDSANESSGDNAVDSIAPATPDFATPRIELLLVGHLPVRGSLWLTPYADSLAREIGPVALVRLDSDHPTLEIMRGKDDWRAEIAGRSLHQSIEFLASRVCAWIIQPAEMDQALSPSAISQVDRIMLLSGADQAASVAAYQTFKRIKLEADDAEIDPPSLALAVVGSAPESATWMVRRLQATAMSQLGISIELARVMPRIDSEARSTMYLRFTDDSIADIDDLLAMIDEAVAAHKARTSSEIARAEPRKRAPLRLQPRMANGQQHAETKRADVAAAAPSISRAAPGDDQPTVAAKEWDPVVRQDPSAANDPVVTVMPRVKLEPKAAHRKSDAVVADAARATRYVTDPRCASVPLAKHVPGLTPLQIRSPRSRDVELAVDAKGNLHLLAEESHLRELRITEAWAREHRELLAVALTERGASPEASVICHLFTNEPASVADLHGTDIKLHVLAPVEVDGRTGWYAAALNH